MPGIEEAQIQRLEKESERFTNEIKQKEKENVMLLEQIATLQCQIEQSNNLLREVTKVSDDNDAREEEIVELRRELKKLRMKTFPRITAAKASESL